MRRTYATRPGESSKPAKRSGYRFAPPLRQERAGRRTRPQAKGSLSDIDLTASLKRAGRLGQAIQKKKVDVTIDTPTRPRMIAEDRTSLVHGSSGELLKKDDVVGIHDNVTFRSRLQTDQPGGKAYRENAKDTVWYKIATQNAYLRQGTFTIDPVRTDITSLLRMCKKQRVSLARQLELAIDHYASTVTIDLLLPSIEAVPQSARDAVWQNAKLMTKAKRNLDLDTYLALLPALRVFNAPETTIEEGSGKWTSHMPSMEADQEIKGYLQTIAMEAITRGRRVEGEVSVVGDSDWNLAFERQWKPFGYDDPTICNAFVDVNQPKRHVWVHKDRGNAGTVIHEGFHKYASPTLRNRLIGQYDLQGISNLDEGLTEYFTREITSKLGIERGNYESDHSVAVKLANVVGRDTLAMAYFGGDYEGLKQAFETGTRWRWIDFTNALERDKDRETAKSHL